MYLHNKGQNFTLYKKKHSQFKLNNMEVSSISFLKRTLGIDVYNQGKDIARVAVPVATIILIIIYALTFIVHWSVLSAILNLVTGTSIIFAAYLLGVILVFDKCIPIELRGDSFYGYKLPKEMPSGYKKTRMRTFIMILLAIIMVYVSNRYKKYYAFECTTFIIDSETHTYHLEKCKYIKEASDLSEMKGYEVEENDYSPCILCEEQAEETDAAYSSDRLFKR